MISSAIFECSFTQTGRSARVKLITMADEKLHPKCLFGARKLFRKPKIKLLKMVIKDHWPKLNLFIDPCIQFRTSTLLLSFSTLFVDRPLVQRTS